MEASKEIIGTSGNVYSLKFYCVRDGYIYLKEDFKAIDIFKSFKGGIQNKSYLESLKESLKILTSFKKEQTCN